MSLQRLTFKINKSNVTERGELMKWLLEHINPSRKRAGFKSLSYPRISMLIAGIPTKDLYYIKAQMKDLGGEKAIKWFYWSLKNQV